MFGAELEYAAKDWLVLKEAEGKRPDTIRAYGEHLHIFLKWLAGRELTPFAFVTFFRDYRQDHAVKSCQTIYTTMRTFLKGIGQLDLAGQMKKPEGDVPPKKVYTEGQLRALFLLLRADLSPTILRNHAIVCLLRYCGVRASEVCRLRLDDLIGHEDLVKIRGGKSRYAKRDIPLISPTPQVLAVYLTRGRPKLLRGYSDYLFLTEDGTPLTRNTLRLALNRLGKKVGFPISAHRFRHTWATAHVRVKTNPKVIGYMAGWLPKSLYEMMEVYGHPDLQDMRDAQREAFGG